MPTLNAVDATITAAVCRQVSAAVAANGQWTAPTITNGRVATKTNWGGSGVDLTLTSATATLGPLTISGIDSVSFNIAGQSGPRRLVLRFSRPVRDPSIQLNFFGSLRDERCYGFSAPITGHSGQCFVIDQGRSVYPTTGDGLGTVSFTGLFEVIEFVWACTTGGNSGIGGVTFTVPEVQMDAYMIAGEGPARYIDRNGTALVAPVIVPCTDPAADQVELLRSSVRSVEVAGCHYFDLIPPGPTTLAPSTFVPASMTLLSLSVRVLSGTGSIIDSDGSVVAVPVGTYSWSAGSHGGKLVPPVSITANAGARVVIVMVVR